MDHPGLARFIAQAWIGYIVANFTLILARILLVPEQGNDSFVFWLVVVFIFGLGVGPARLKNVAAVSVHANCERADCRGR